MATIVRESPEHFCDVRQLTIDAFAASKLGHHGEADLIEAIRIQSDNYLSLVAIEAERIVGHILFSPATIRTKTSVAHGMGLAPLAVLPTHQRLGIGSALVNDGLQRLAETASAFTIVAGHVDYYPRFGFLPARGYAITHAFKGMPQEILFVRPRSAAIASRLNGGRAYYHAAFGPQHDG